MRRGVKAVEDSNSGDQLAWLVLRVIAALSPCKKTSLIAYVSGSTSELRRTASDPYTRELILNVLLKLEALDFIEFAQEKITITDEARRFLDELPVVASRPRRPYAAFLRALARTLLAESSRLKRFCQDCPAGVHAAMSRNFHMHGSRARDIALQLWKCEVAPVIGSRATTLVHILRRLATVCRTRAEAAAIVLANWRTQSGALLRKAGKASRLSPNAKLAGLSRLVIFAGALLLVALSTTGGVALLSGNRAESSREAPMSSPEAIVSSREATMSSPEAPIVSSRESPIVWFYDGQDRPKRSIFVTREFSGATWIDGLAIRGENTSDQLLTAVQGTIKLDTGQEIKLSVSAAGSQQTQADAHDVLSRSEFILEHGFHPDASGQQAGMPAEEFISKNGGMIFKFSYTVAGVQTTLIEYFSPSKLKNQLVDAESAESSQ
jgi:hypothetical protein